MLLFLLLFLVSCSVTIDSTEFNSQIASRTDINSPEELIKLYYGPYEVEGNSKLTITTKNSDHNKFEITLIHNGIGDDSVSDIRIVMTAKRNKHGLFCLFKKVGSAMTVEVILIGAGRNAVRIV